MKPTFYKGIALGAAVSVLVLVASTAVAGTGVGGIFNLGASNTVNGTTGLSGSTAGPQLKVSNANTANHTVLAQAGGGAGVALYGQHTTAGGAGPAIRGDSASTAANAYSIYGLLSPSTPLGANAAVRGNNRATNGLGYGVWGSHAGSGSGVYGTSAAGPGVLGKSTSSNGTQGISGSADASGVYGENDSSGGYGVAGRSLGSNGIGVYGDSPPAGWAGYFTGKVHLGGALNCSGCVGSGALAQSYYQSGSKVDDSGHADNADSVGGQTPAALQTHGYYAHWDSNYGTYNVPYNSATAIVSFTLPAGNYIVNASAEFINDANYFGGENRRAVHCWVLPRYPGSAPSATVTLSNGIGYGYGSVSQSELVALASAGAVSYMCDNWANDPSNVRGTSATLTAIRLAAVN
jgi:hypothetical protein